MLTVRPAWSAGIIALPLIPFVWHNRQSVYPSRAWGIVGIFAAGVVAGVEVETGLEVLAGAEVEAGVPDWQPTSRMVTRSKPAIAQHDNFLIDMILLNLLINRIFHQFYIKIPKCQVIKMSG